MSQQSQTERQIHWMCSNTTEEKHKNRVSSNPSTIGFRWQELGLGGWFVLISKQDNILKHNVAPQNKGIIKMIQFMRFVDENIV